MTLSTSIVALVLAATVSAPKGSEPDRRAERASFGLPLVRGMAKVDGGAFRPVFPPSEKEQTLNVAPFFLDKTAVTNAHFLLFVKANPKWRREQVARVFADTTYLSHWESALALGENAPAEAPVVRVSWFAAKAYCQARGARLPTEGEWELAAAASETKKDGRNDRGFSDRILQWYAEKTPARLPNVASQKPNAYGVYDLHGLVWEWVQDYGNTMLNTDSRSNGKDPNRFCGGGAVAAGDKRDYAAFMRVAMRGSLKGNFALQTLGFRCAMDLRGARR